MDSIVNLFCFPFAGGSSYSYKNFVDSAPDNIRLISFDLPGRGRRSTEALLSDIDNIVDDLFIKIKDSLHAPYAFYGHSMGTLLSYLLTRRIIRYGYQPPLHLFMSGRGGPSSALKNGICHNLPRLEFFNALRELGGFPTEVLDEEEIMLFFEPILRADFKALETYQYQAPSKLFSIPITIMIGREEEISDDELLLWQKETTTPIAIQYFAGNHFFIIDHAKEIMEVISRTFSQAQLGKTVY
jgi:surfactin synthase thioesterase subunit